MRLWCRVLRWQCGDAPPLSTLTTTYRRDYSPSAYRVESIDLHIELDAELTTVRSQLLLHRAVQAAPHAALVLDGRELELLEIRLDGQELPATRYQQDSRQLTITGMPAHARLQITTRTRPAANSALEGLYQSGQMLCTQCEAHGFSRITYFIDRPDVMATYRVTLSAARDKYPVLLANGNPVARGMGEAGRHWVTWVDPFPKPCYLFAVVAGDLALVEDEFITQSGRRVDLRIYVEAENRTRCGHAMASLKQAMRWDEQAYGREYDLDIFMIVAVGSFNMGAMENKGLNLFNAKYIIADPQTATDDDHEAVRDIIGHEYFHNWTGNRITCRDWFQLSVKESLTVFREQQFSAAMGAVSVARIRQARLIRTQQFPEDAGPTAHPVRPDAYVEVNNLYTLTVYEKGAEVIRMIHTLLGAEAFRRAMDCYFERHDGQAVTVEDFIKAMEDASGRDLAQFRLWYSQAGTPVVKARLHYDPATQCHELKLEQSCSPTPGQAEKQALHVPLRMALVDESGRMHHEQLLELRQASQTHVFEPLPGPCSLSLLRDFSAPVQVQGNLDERQLGRLVLHAQDAFASWDAMQQLFLQQLLQGVDQARHGKASLAGSELLQTLEGLLRAEPRDQALLAELVQMPSEAYLLEQYAEADIDAIFMAWDGLRQLLSDRLYAHWLDLYQHCSSATSYQPDAASVARRRLRAACLAWLCASGREEAHALAMRQYMKADNMTDAQSALLALNDSACPERVEALAHFRDRWQQNPLVLDKWFNLQAATRLPTSHATVCSLLADPLFDLRNPNRVRALLGSFAFQNLRGFHRPDGKGYALVAEHILRLDALNPQVAARLASAFTRWRRLDGQRHVLMGAQLRRLHANSGLSMDVAEIVSKTLGPG